MYEILAGSAANCQYAGTNCADLPFTGLDVALLVMVAAVLIALGLILRSRRTR